jgi:soluble lytic murein transglycosylase
VSPLSRKSKGRLRLLAVAIVIVVAIVVVIVWAATRTVVPGVTAKMYPIRYVDTIGTVSHRYGLDPYLLAAVARTESNFNPAAVSPVGAVGVMQIMPETAKWIAGLNSWKGDKRPVLTDPTDSLELGACYLEYLIQRFDGDVSAALAAYNAGPNTVDDWIKKSGSDAAFRVEDIPFKETRDFVGRVQHYRDVFTRAHPGVFAVTASTSGLAIAARGNAGQV